MLQLGKAESVADCRLRVRDAEARDERSGKEDERARRDNGEDAANHRPYYGAGDAAAFLCRIGSRYGQMLSAIAFAPSAFGCA